MYLQVIEEFKVYGQLSGERNEAEFASALEQGFHSAGWKGAPTKGIETRQVQRKTAYSSAYTVAALHADLGDKHVAYQWLNTASPHVSLSWCAKWGCRSRRVDCTWLTAACGAAEELRQHRSIIERTARASGESVPVAR